MSKQDQKHARLILLSIIHIILPLSVVCCKHSSYYIVYLGLTLVFSILLFLDTTVRIRIVNKYSY